MQCGGAPRVCASVPYPHLINAITFIFKAMLARLPINVPFPWKREDRGFDAYTAGATREPRTFCFHKTHKCQVRAVRAGAGQALSQHRAAWLGSKLPTSAREQGPPATAWAMRIATKCSLPRCRGGTRSWTVTTSELCWTLGTYVPGRRPVRLRAAEQGGVDSYLLLSRELARMGTSPDVLGSVANPVPGEPGRAAQPCRTITLL